MLFIHGGRRSAFDRACTELGAWVAASERGAGRFDGRTADDGRTDNGGGLRPGAWWGGVQPAKPAKPSQSIHGPRAAMSPRTAIGLHMNQILQERGRTREGGGGRGEEGGSNRRPAPGTRRLGEQQFCCCCCCCCLLLLPVAVVAVVVWPLAREESDNVSKPGSTSVSLARFCLFRSFPA